MNKWREGMEWIHGERDGIEAWRLRMEWIHEESEWKGLAGGEGVEWIHGVRGKVMDAWIEGFEWIHGERGWNGCTEIENGYMERGYGMERGVGYMERG